MATKNHIRDITKKVRLIDAMDTVTKISKRVQCLLGNPVSQHIYDVILQCIAEAPTVDAVEVVHGHWFSLTDCSNAGVYCSVCHKKVWREDYAWCNRKNKLRSNYCPNCGADMRERKDND